MTYSPKENTMKAQRVRTVILSKSSASITTCRWCDAACVYSERRETWLHEAHETGDDAVIRFGHDAEPVFTIRSMHRTYDVGDRVIVEAIDGTWVGDVYDTTDDRHTAYMELV